MKVQLACLQTGFEPAQFVVLQTPRAIADCFYFPPESGNPLRCFLQSELGLPRDATAIAKQCLEWELEWHGLTGDRHQTCDAGFQTGRLVGSLIEEAPQLRHDGERVIKLRICPLLIGTDSNQVFRSDVSRQ